MQYIKLSDDKTVQERLTLSCQPALHFRNRTVVFVLFMSAGAMCNGNTVLMIGLNGKGFRR